MQENRNIVSAYQKKYSYEKLNRDLALLCGAYPEQIRYEIIGRSEDDRKIYDVILGNPEAHSCVLVVAAIHGREYMTSLLCMKQIEYYASHPRKMEGCRRITDILEEIAIHYIPMANPDGVAISQFGTDQVCNQGLRRNLENIHEGKTARWKANARGVDLNRNFPYHFYVSGNAGEEGYSGAEAVSERESKALFQRIAFLEEMRGLQGAVHYHAMGNEIFGECRKDAEAYEKTRLMSVLAQKITGYLAAEPDFEEDCGEDAHSNNGNLREQMLYGNKIPGITVEIGKYPCPGPILEFPRIWRKNRELVIQEAGLLLECR